MLVARRDVARQLIGSEVLKGKHSCSAVLEDNDVGRVGGGPASDRNSQ